MQNVPCFSVIYASTYLHNYTEGCSEAMEEGLLDANASCDLGRPITWYLVNFTFFPWD